MTPLVIDESEQGFGVMLNNIEIEKEEIDKKKYSESKYAIPQKLVMLKDTKGIVKTFLMKIVADYEYFEKSLTKDKKNKTKNNGNDFDGSVILYNWGEPQIAQAFRYKNGKPKGIYSPAKNGRVSGCEVVGFYEYFPCSSAPNQNLVRIGSETRCGLLFSIGYNCSYEGSSTVINTPSFFIDGAGGYSAEIISSSYRANVVDNFIMQASQYGVTFNPDERLDFIDNFGDFLLTKEIFINAPEKSFDPTEPSSNIYYHVLLEASWLKAKNPNWGDIQCLAVAYKNVLSNVLHYSLDIGGLVPGVGEALDLINGGIYLIEGNGTDASLSFAATLPIGGQLATLGKWGRNVLKFDNAIEGFISKSGIIFKLGSIHGNRLSHVLAHGANDLSKPLQGVFYGSSKEILSVVDEAWEKKIAQNIQPSSGDNVFEIDMGRSIGWEGGSQGTGAALTKIRIIMSSGTSNQIISAYPIH
jgi:hypothetical protein